MSAETRTFDPEAPRCVLCGYQAIDYLILPVPLATPAQENVICLDCAEDIAELLQARKAQEKPCS